ncbi:MAG: hypothetical protein NXI13_06540 [Proteobacteria bacterium]|nr:hypothetical protein [Pseudomonadota bacterium]
MSEELSSPVQFEGLEIHDMASTDWVAVGKPGLFYKPARVDLDSGKFLGLFRFDAFAESGLHQHVDVGASYILSGSVTDYSGNFTQGCIGINPPGDTHDALSYDGALITSRLEGSSIYPPKAEELNAIHPGAYRHGFQNAGAMRDPIVVPYHYSGIEPSKGHPEGVTMRLLYDYAGTDHDFRMSSLHLDPGARTGPFTTQAGLDIFVVAGDLEIAGQSVKANQFVSAPSSAELEISSHFGCHLICWSEAPVISEGPDPFGF